MSSRTSYPKRRNTQPLNRRQSSVTDSGLARSVHNPEVKREDKRGVDHADPLADRMAYLTTSEAASYLRVSKQFLEIARHRGDGPPYIKLARAVRYYRPSLDQWMLERQRNHTAEREI
jgi:Helix-turn-helix domain